MAWQSIAKKEHQLNKQQLLERLPLTKKELTEILLARGVSLQTTVGAANGKDTGKGNSRVLARAAAKAPTRR